MKHDPNEFFVRVMYGGVPNSRNSRIKFPSDIIVGTPGRLIDNINRGILKLDNLRTLVIDEVHQMMEKNFLLDLETIHEKILDQAQKSPQLIMLSATLPPELKRTIARFCDNKYKFIDLAQDLHNRTPPNIKHYVMKVPYGLRQKILSKILEKYASKKIQRSLVFANTKQWVKDLVEKISTIKVDGLHGDMPQIERQQVFRRFKKGRSPCIIATDVASRGIDIPNLDLVVQLEPSMDSDTYVHRAGRTARAGKEGVVISLWDDRDEALRLKKTMHDAGIKFIKIKFDEATDEIMETTEVERFNEELQSRYDDDFKQGKKFMNNRRFGNKRHTRNEFSSEFY